MRVAFLTGSLDEAHGWGRFAAGFLADARRRYGDANVIAPDPSRLRSNWARWHQPFLAIADALALRRELRGCDVIHAVIEPVAPVAFFLSLLLHKPYVISLHGTYADLRTYAPSVRWLYRLAFGRAALLLPVSGYTADVVRRAFPRKRLEIVPGGFSSASASGGQAGKNGPGSPPRILSVGAVKPRKGFHTLVEALGRLRAKGFAFHADIVGPKHTEAYVARLEARLRELGLERDVRLLGRIPQEALDQAYAEADLFVLPSEHDGTGFEGLGLVYLEALSRGLPAIGCLESGAEEIIRDGVNGRLVPPGAAERLERAIEETLGRPDGWKRLSAAAPASVERFRWECVGDLLRSAYQAAIDAYAR